jgi:hypothetical protein
MIDSLSLPLSQFDLRSFIRQYRQFYRTWSGDDSLAYFIVGVEKHDDIPTNFLADDDEDQEEAIHEALTSDGAKVFFMLHEPAADERFLCIDGKKRDSEELDIGLEDGYGFLVEVNGENLSLHPALYDGSDDPPSLMIQGTCSILEGPMMEFVQRFVRE